MAKVKSKYVCQNCGYENPKWLGKCPECLQWNTFVEEIEEKMTPRQESLAKQASRSTSRPVSINSIAPKREERFSTRTRQGLGWWSDTGLTGIGRRRPRYR